MSSYFEELTPILLAGKAWLKRASAKFSLPVMLVLAPQNNLTYSTILVSFGYAKENT